MVYLNRIYTKSGDGGETSLGDGSRVSKTHPRIIAYGSVDELNSVLGLALSVGIPNPWDSANPRDWLRQVQNDLFDVGADLCVPVPGSPPEKQPLRITPEHVSTLEAWIDAANEGMQPLESFILPGGSPAAAHLHHARTVCRRVEITVWQLAEKEQINPQIAVYLNRLSDLLFVLARVCNDNGENDVLWVPGEGPNPDNAE